MMMMVMMMVMLLLMMMLVMEAWASVGSRQAARFDELGAGWVSGPAGRNLKNPKDTL